MKKFIKRLIPDFLLYLKIALPEYYYDMINYYRYSATISQSSSSKLVGRIIMAYHIIEKGLTMPEPRLGFGKAKLIELIDLCVKYVKLYGATNEQVIHGIKVVKEYELFHQSMNFSLDNELVEKITNLKEISKEITASKQKKMTKDEYFKNWDSSFPEFSNSRLSVRNYSSENIPVEVLTKAVDLSRNTPSACNRQTSRVYIYTDKNEIEAILKMQGGNRGFGHLGNKLIVVTAEQGVFADMNERYQAYIDGGMFAMNLLYALHSEKVAACILNCSHLASKDKKIRKVAKIKESEVFIAMILCGYAPDEFKVAFSYRNSLETYLTVS